MAFDREQIKEWILTDYLDGECDDQRRELIERALAEDPEIRAFFDLVKGQAEPLEAMANEHPPEQVWQGIEQALIQGKLDESPESSAGVVRRWWQAVFSRPRISGAAGLVTVIITVVILGRLAPRSQPALTAQKKDQQVEYLIMLLEDPSGLDDEESEGFESSIENYFL